MEILSLDTEMTLYKCAAYLVSNILLTHVIAHSCRVDSNVDNFASILLNPYLLLELQSSKLLLSIFALLLF